MVEGGVGRRATTLAASERGLMAAPATDGCQMRTGGGVLGAAGHGLGQAFRTAKIGRL